MVRGLKMNSNDRRKLAISEIVLILLGVMGLLAVLWVAWFRPIHKDSRVASYDECVAAGNPVQTSFPSVCVTKEGKRFVNPADEKQLQQSPTGSAVRRIETVKYSASTNGLRQAIVGAVQAATPACVHDGGLVDSAGVASDPNVVTQDEDGHMGVGSLALLAYSCGDASVKAVFENDKAGTWQLRDTDKDGFSCDIIASMAANEKLFAAAGFGTECVNASGGTEPIDRQHL